MVKVCFASTITLYNAPSDRWVVVRGSDVVVVKVSLRLRTVLVKFRPDCVKCRCTSALRTKTALPPLTIRHHRRGAQSPHTPRQLRNLPTERPPGVETAPGPKKCLHFPISNVNVFLWDILCQGFL